MTIMSGKPLDFSPDGSGLTQRFNAPGSKQHPTKWGRSPSSVELGRTLSVVPRHLPGDDAGDGGKHEPI